MKSYKLALLTFTSILFIATASSVTAGGSCSSKSCKNTSKAAQYQKYAESYDSQADKAKEKGQTKLAAALEKCAAAKRKMAYGFETGNSSTVKAGYAAYKQAKTELKSAKKEIYGSCSKKKSTCSSSSKKSSSCNSYASKASESKTAAKKYESLATSATEEGNVLKAGLLRQCAAASNLIGQGYSNSDKKMISKGMYQLGMAQSELQKLNKNSSSKSTTIASDNSVLPSPKL